MAIYSNNVAEWTAGTYNIGDQRGWSAQVWTANKTTTDEPGLESNDWDLDTSEKVSGFTIISLFREVGGTAAVQTTGFTIMKEHFNRPPTVNLSGLTLLRQRNKPYMKVVFN